MAFDNNTYQLPRNIEAEKSFLLACIHGKDVVCQSGATPSDFFDENNKCIFMALEKLVQLGRPTDVANLVQIGREKGALAKMGGEKYLETFTFGPSSTDSWRSYHDIIRLCSTQRWAIKAAEAVKKEAISGAKTPEQLHGLIETALSKDFPKSSLTRKVSVADNLSNIMSNFEEATKHPGRVTGLKTGIHSLDNAVRGLKPCYFIIAARPSVGKSAIATQMALHMAKNGKKVFFASPEMTAEDQLKRMLCMESGVSARLIDSGGVTAYQAKKFREAYASIKDVVSENIRFDDQGDITPAQIRARALQFKRENGGQLDAIFVDYLQYLGFDERTNNTYEKVSGISTALKNMGKELGCLTVALAQINRMDDETEPQLHNLKDSGKIEQDADIVAILHRMKKRCQETDWKDVISFNIAKGRSIGLHKFNLLFNPEATKFSEMDPVLERKLTITQEQWNRIDKPGADVFEELIGKQKEEESMEAPSEFMSILNQSQKGE